MTIASNKQARRRKGKQVRTEAKEEAGSPRRRGTGQSGRKLKLAGAGLLALLAILIGVSVYRAQAAKIPSVPDTAVVATIDGEPVTAAEFLGMQTTKRAGVYDYFQQTYKLGDTPDFWTSAYGGERPADKLREETMTAIAGDKVQLMLAKQEGIVQDITYEAVLKQWESENKRRAQTLKKGGLVYGPAHLDAAFYYDTWLTENVERLKAKLAQRDAFTEAQVNAYYEQHIADYIGQATIRTSVVSLTCQPEDCKAADSSARKQMEQVRAGLAAGEDWTTLEERYKNSGSAVQFASRTFDAASAKEDTMMDPLLLQAAKKLHRNEVSGLVEENGVLYVVKVLSVEQPKAVPVSEFSGQIRKQLSDEAYAKLIAARTKQADIVIDHRVYDKLEAE
ncbi:peptidyl-prolyl cis-trans isomerase [Paenibacillus rhizovicinus]|uniref:Peptidyl-prolyl cis-trans isomerase n=1 Tax=Paenibacillus rhizovicinus TaxID=2704463 RepID=A0A6C0P3C0_9BACL|nr:peptidylprolyl isomerase [Paenibacillus rhizovicinus]QHW32945.1 peptidyl-prolyl cis-trans isomerase [Paenibacillus rhizovicinus]